MRSNNQAIERKREKVGLFLARNVPICRSVMTETEQKARDFDLIHPVLSATNVAANRYQPTFVSMTLNEMYL